MSDRAREISRFIQEWCGCLPDDSISIHDAYFGIACKSTLFRGLPAGVTGWLVDLVAEQQSELSALRERLKVAESFIDQNHKVDYRKIVSQINHPEESK